jgi:hypothetical protein
MPPTDKVDGLTWCNNGKCSEVSVEYPDYKPPSYRGGVGENEPAIKRRRSSTLTRLPSHGKAEGRGA